MSVRRSKSWMFAGWCCLLAAWAMPRWQAAEAGEWSWVAALAGVLCCVVSLAVDE